MTVYYSPLDKINDDNILIEDMYVHMRNSATNSRKDDIRSPFARDYTRVLHSLAYRRLKHKTQVFFNAAGNDHICTRIEHVQHVESVSNTIAKELGLNEELTRAIAIAHDLGHAPFGHQGEDVIKKLTQKYLEKDFWHEQNGVYFVDDKEHRDMIHQLIRVRFKNKENDENKLRKFIQANSGALE